MPDFFNESGFDNQIVSRKITRAAILLVGKNSRYFVKGVQQVGKRKGLLSYSMNLNNTDLFFIRMFL